MKPVEITLLNIAPAILGRIKQVTVLDTYEGSTKDFHTEGLYSTEIFGPLGTEERNNTFGYIDIRIPILNPAFALTLFELKKLYKDVMAGKRFATWDASLKDFMPAQPGDEGADTGYTFFMSKFEELQPKRTKSLIRNANIDLIDKFRGIALSKYVLVLPAGLRDLQINDNGRDQEEEINPLYRSLLSSARLIPSSGKKDDPSNDKVRWALQDTFIQIYKLLFSVIEGKGGWMRGKVGKRNIRHGTRNVLSSMNPVSPVIGREDAVRATDTFLGLYQSLKALEPIAVNKVLSRYLPPLDGGPGKLWLVNSDTLKRELVEVGSEDYDHFTTTEGVEYLINKFRELENKHGAVRVAKHYIALIWTGKPDEFKIFYDIEELPEGYKRKDVKPLSYAELLYLSGYDVWNDYFIIPTRYPVAGDGSTYSSTLRVATTTTSEMRYELEDDWTTRREKPAIEFPKRKVAEFVSSMILASHRLAGMQADFDGDTGSADSVLTNEALEENRERMNDVSYWIRPDGSLTMDIGNDLVERTVHNLMSD